MCAIHLPVACAPRHECCAGSCRPLASAVPNLAGATLPSACVCVCLTKEQSTSHHSQRFPSGIPLPKRHRHQCSCRRRHAPYLMTTSRVEMLLGRVRPIPSSNATAARTSWVGGCRRRAFHVVRPAFHSVLEAGARGSTRPGGVNSGFTAPVRWSRIPSNCNSHHQTRSDHMESSRANDDSYVVRLST